MTPQEINEAVARKLGCLICKPPCKWPHSPNDDGIIWCEIKDYCGDIRAAWEIVQFLINGKWMIFNPGNTNTWVASITDLPYGSKSDAEAGTAPMAICLAFLKLEERKLLTEKDKKV